MYRVRRQNRHAYTGKKGGKFMKKKMITFAVAGCMALAMSFTAMAGQWKEDANGWWYDNEDGTYPASCWKWIDGNGDGTAECYYFGPDGYMYADRKTPDGKTVTVEGKWIHEGAIQTMDAASVQDQNSYLRNMEPWSTDYYISTPETATDAKGVTYINPLVLSCVEANGASYCEYACSGYVRLRADKIALAQGSRGELAREVVITVHDTDRNKILGTVRINQATEDAVLDVDIIGKGMIKISARITGGEGSSANIIFDNLRLVK